MSEINTDNYKPNSHKYKEAQKKEVSNSDNKKKVEKIVNGKVKNKTGLRKFVDDFFSDDASNVTGYILNDVIKPAFKKLLQDVITNGTDIILWGKNGRRSSGSFRSSFISYDKCYTSQPKAQAIMSANRYDQKSIILNTRGEAEEVLSRMDELIDMYGIVSVADLYDLIGVDSNYTDNKYGWKNIKSADVIPVRDGYTLKLPRALPIQ